jgi:branched-chain amino acid aminotransferase
MNIKHYLYSEFNLSLKDIPEFSSAPATLDAASLQLPVGVYTTFRTFPGSRVLRLNDHFRRLENSMALIGGDLQIKDGEFRKVIADLFRNSGFDLARIRISINQNASSGFDCFFIVDKLLTPTPMNYANGVEVITRQLHRDNAEAKVTQFIKSTDELRKLITGSINEILMVDDDGNFLEGLSSNIFCVKDDVVYTADAGVLPGITRSTIIELIQKRGYSIDFNGYPLQNIHTLDELFLTSTTRSVLPVVSVDGHRIGTGKPGAFAQQLLADYEGFITQNLEPIE